ncbi:hypothetical protein LPB86_08020 [Pedobacter sp. MC2016-14]|uniref:hypothetical protein n=1 Tax=Pedobacter sp. MC2016-14 TaxID=2897327 RepID=UPI001E310E82|nr:hypothetical protein [Pedobacter sp. MC2016-14]MCD0488172.1 hypothetical protein [Pedobacter sp. MC2016-14]
MNKDTTPYTEHKTTKDQPSKEEAAEQLKGSDADVDKQVGFDDQPDDNEKLEQQKGSDADVDQ